MDGIMLPTTTSTVTPPPSPPSDPNTVLEVTLPGEPDNKLTATVTEVGVKFDLTQNTSKFGYRIYRSTTQGIEGISISDFPLTGGQFVDVNIDPDTKYYYAIRKVLEEASLDRETVSIIPEVLGESSKEIVLNSGPVVSPWKPLDTEQKYRKNFILMKIGEPEMLFNETMLEIDPGRGTTPQIVRERAMVPVRAIIETMGGTVGWDDAEKQVSLMYGDLSAMDFEVYMNIDSRELTANGEKKTMDVAPQIINDRTMLPIRFVTENVGGEIAWIGSTREIIIVFFTKAG